MKYIDIETGEEREGPDLPEPKLSMMASMAIYAHGTGTPKCPWCGKFRKEEDFYNSPTSVTGTTESGPIHIDFGPMCKNCREKRK